MMDEEGVGVISVAAVTFFNSDIVLLSILASFDSWHLRPLALLHSHNLITRLYANRVSLRLSLLCISL